MATGAVGAELAAVHIVTMMTATAIAGHGPSFTRRAHVAGDTFEVRVGAIEPKVCLGVVIEGPDAPVIGRVAVGALLPEMSLVRVIGTVAIDAFRGCAFESLVHVAGLAGRRCMQAREWKSCQVVIEAHVRLPALFAMTGTTVGAKRLLVRVIRAMT